MNEVALKFSHVWKKFKRGEKYDSLRDLIPAMTRRLFSGNHRGELQEKEFWAVKDVSFQVRRGEAIGVIGPNGAGKSTILKLLSGILRPNKGDIKVNGRLSALIEVGAGFHPDLTGRENIYLNGTILGMTRREIDSKFDEIVEFSGISDFIDTPVKRFSSGMHARLGFSVAAHINPDILLVDEVLSVGDMQFQQRCVNKMLSLKDQDTTIIFVSHNLESVQILCPQTILLQNGQIIRMGDTAEVIKDYVCSARITVESQNNVAKIDHVILCNKFGQNAFSFRPGDNAELLFTLRCGKPLDECLLGFVVNRDTDALPVCDYNIPLTLLDNGNEPGDREIPVKVTFDINLLRGAYTISLFIYHSRTTEFLHRCDNIIIFTVEERMSWRGVSHLKPNLKRMEVNMPRL